MRRRGRSSRRSRWRSSTTTGRSPRLSRHASCTTSTRSNQASTSARLAPLLLVDEFAPERIDAPTREWYEAQHRLLVAAGADPLGPSDLRDWAARHPDLHPSHVVLGKLDARFETRYLEWRPYLYRWLGDPATEELERGLIDAGAIRALGFRYAGRVRK